jgi:osmoprotectant transport system substrate-binding protein
VKTRLIAVGAAVAAVLCLAACGGSGAAASGKTIAGNFIFGAAPEFKTRTDGLPGLQKEYGVVFQSFKPLDAGGPLTINALKSGQIDAANIFTTDPSIKTDHFVALQDPKNLYLAQNIVPLISTAKATPGVTATLDAVSAKLTTEDVIQLNMQVITDKKDPVTVAQNWLSSKGLGATGSDATDASLTVGSANFQEDVVLADIYAQALRNQGADVQTKLDIGSRETYIPGLQDGSIDLVPEYSGVLLQYFDKNANPSPTPQAVYTALKKAVPHGLSVLAQALAQDKDAIVVTAATAAKYHVVTIGDLAKSSF